MPTCIVFVSFGNVGSFMILWLANLDLFPVVYSTTALGFCNLTARFVTILAPMIAELPEPVPENTLFALSFGAVFLSFFVKEKTKSFY